MKKKYPQILWHYTTLNSFEKILSTKSLRSTHYRFLNDHKELILGLNIINDIITSEYPEDNFFKQLKANIEKYKSTTSPNSFFITSFSAQKDSLYQWVAYTDKVNGGCSIGFDPLKMGIAYEPECRSRKSGNFIFNRLKRCKRPFKCYYCSIKDVHPEIKEEVKKHVQKCLDECKKKDGFDINNLETFQFIQRLNSINLLFDALTIKHNGFKNEEEYRYFTYTLNIDADADNLKPYTDSYLSKNKFLECIKEVMISPHGNQERNRDIVEFVRAKNRLNFDIIMSDIPFRG